MGFFDFFKSKETKPEPRKSSGVFAPEGSGYKEVIDAPQQSSFNTLTEFFGYHPDQMHSVHKSGKESDIYSVGFEVFTKNVVFVSTKDSVCTIDSRKLAPFMDELDDDTLFDSYKVNSTLQDGIENKSLKYDFLARVLGIQDAEPDGVFYAAKIGMYLYFSNGFLTDFQSSDGLGHWAKHWKQLNPRIIDSYEKEAKRFWGSNHKQVLNEINVQSDALADVPQAVSNPYIHLHTNERGVTNFHMLLVAHYGKEITLPEFLAINHGRYTQVLALANDDESVYTLGNHTYHFSKDGSLVNFSQN